MKSTIHLVIACLVTTAASAGGDGVLEGLSAEDAMLGSAMNSEGVAATQRTNPASATLPRHPTAGSGESESGLNNSGEAVARPTHTKLGGISRDASAEADPSLYSAQNGGAGGAGGAGNGGAEPAPTNTGEGEEGAASLRNVRPASFLYAGDHVWQGLETSCMKFYEKPADDATVSRRVSASSVPACQRQCDAAPDMECECVHFFEVTRHCYLFNQSECASARRFNATRWADLLGKNSAWGRINVTRTFSISLTTTMDLAPGVSSPEPDTPSPALGQGTEVHVSTKGPMSIFLSPSHALYLFLPLMVLVSLLFMYQHLRYRKYEREMLLAKQGTHDRSFAMDTEMSRADQGPRPDCVEVKRPPSDWQRGKLIGRGSFGKVFIALCPDGAMLAVKTIELGHNLTPQQLKMVTKEIQVLSDLDHPAIVTCIGCRFDPIVCELHIFMEYMPGGSLGQLARKLGSPLRESTARLYIRQTLDGVAYMHQKGIVHRDIKGDNILLSATGAVKLADFGASSYLHSEVGCLSGDANVGTPLWMAPEVIAKSSQPTPASDVWAVGIVTCEVLNQGKPPWASFDNNMQALYHIARWRLPLPGPNLPACLSPACFSFLEECHRLDPSLRPAAAALLDHPWLSKVKEPLCASPSPLIEKSEDLHKLYRSSNLESSRKSSESSGRMCSARGDAEGSPEGGGAPAGSAVFGGLPLHASAEGAAGVSLAHDFATVSLVSSPEEGPDTLSTYAGSQMVSPPLDSVP